MKHIRLVCLVLVALFLLVACATPGDDDSNGTTTPTAMQPGETTPADTSGDETTLPAYEFPDVTYNNEVFRIFNGTQSYNMIMNVTAADVTGEKVSDSIHNNVVTIEEQFHVKLEETLSPFGSDMLTVVRTEMQSGDAKHDVVYLYSTLVGSLIGSGGLSNLYDNEAINMDGEWWNQALKNDATLYGSSLYYLVSDAHLMSFEGTWCMFFNKEIMTNLGIEFPYAAVRSNEWTMEKLYTYAAAGASLNGDASYDWNAGGSSVYGLASFKNLMNALVVGCDAMYVRKDANDVPYYSFPTENSLYDKFEAITRITGEAGTYISANARSSGLHYIETIFSQGRSMLMGGEIKAAANELTETTFEFGIVPIPKYNSAQESFKSNMLWSTLLMTIPVTAPDPERSGVIMDALSYLAMVNTMPVYYDRVSYKGLADNDSIEMLDIINESRYLNWGLTYGWLSSIEPNVNSMLDSGNSSLASLVRSSDRIVPNLINKTLESIKK